MKLTQRSSILGGVLVFALAATMTCSANAQSGSRNAMPTPSYAPAQSYAPTPAGQAYAPTPAGQAYAPNQGYSQCQPYNQGRYCPPCPKNEPSTPYSTRRFFVPGKNQFYPYASRPKTLFRDGPPPTSRGLFGFGRSSNRGNAYNSGGYGYNSGGNAYNSGGYGYNPPY